jgi:acetylglutamate kinase
MKFSGELLRSAPSRDVVSAVAAIVKSGTPVVPWFTAGEEMTRRAAAGIEKRVDGLRITDDATLEIVVAVCGPVLQAGRRQRGRLRASA